MYNTNRHITTIAALVLGVLFTISPAVGSTTLLDENFDSYADGGWPTGFCRFDKNYVLYPNNHVVSGITPPCPSDTKCFMTTNPYSGWGNDVSVPFSWSPSSYDKLIWSAAVMLPLIMNRERKLLPFSHSTFPSIKRRILLRRNEDFEGDKL